MEEVFVTETKGFRTLQIWQKTRLFFFFSFQTKNKAETGRCKSKNRFKGGLLELQSVNHKSQCPCPAVQCCIEEKVLDGSVPQRQLWMCMPERQKLLFTCCAINVVCQKAHFLGISVRALYYLISCKTLSQPPGKLLLEYWQKEIKMKYYVC